MMIGGGGSGCSRADHGIGVTEANSANFGYGPERDFGNDGGSGASAYSLNLWVRWFTVKESNPRSSNRGDSYRNVKKKLAKQWSCTYIALVRKAFFGATAAVEFFGLDCLVFNPETIYINNARRYLKEV